MWLIIKQSVTQIGENIFYISYLSVPTLFLTFSLRLLDFCFFLIQIM